MNDAAPLRLPLVEVGGRVRYVEPDAPLWFVAYAASSPAADAVGAGMSDAEAKATLALAFKLELGRDASAAELQWAQAVSWIETGGRYAGGASGYHGQAGKLEGSNNWGGIQAGKPKGGVCPPGSRLATDTFPTQKGVSVPYEVCFKEYPTPLDGARDFLRVLYVKRPAVLVAARTGNAHAAAAAMYDTTYYQGRGSTREERIDGYARAVFGAMGRIAKSLGEPRAFELGAHGMTEPARAGEVVAFALFGAGLAAAVIRARRRAA